MQWLNNVADVKMHMDIRFLMDNFIEDNLTLKINLK